MRSAHSPEISTNEGKAKEAPTTQKSSLTSIQGGNKIQAMLVSDAGVLAPHWE
jgi:hypothetical protein